MLAYTYIKQGKFKLLRKPKRIIVCEKSPERIRFVREHYPDVWVVEPENCKDFVLRNSAHGGLMSFWKWLVVGGVGVCSSYSSYYTHTDFR